LPEVPGEKGKEKLPYHEEIFDDDTAEDALAPTHKLNGQHEGGLENARLKKKQECLRNFRKECSRSFGKECSRNFGKKCSRETLEAKKNARVY
jgi:hypothetical protein